MLTSALKKVLSEADMVLGDNPKQLADFKHCVGSTINTTVKPEKDKDSFVITGDIPAMWLRDLRQFRYITIDS